MGNATSQIDIDKPADDVWAVVRDFGGLAAWSPGMDSCEVDGDVRTLKMFGMEIVEKLVSSDDDTRTISYSVVSGIPVTHHQATITVNPAGDGSHVTWAVEVEPDEMTDLMKKSYDGALGALKSHVEG